MGYEHRDDSQQMNDRNDPRAGLRRGFSSPGFEQGKQSEYDAAVDRAQAAIMAAWKECGEVPFPLYDREARKLAIAAVDAVRR